MLWVRLGALAAPPPNDARAGAQASARSRRPCAAQPLRRRSRRTELGRAATPPRTPSGTRSRPTPGAVDPHRARRRPATSTRRSTSTSASGLRSTRSRARTRTGAEPATIEIDAVARDVVLPDPGRRARELGRRPLPAARRHARPARELPRARGCRARARTPLVDRLANPDDAWAIKLQRGTHVPAELRLVRWPAARRLSSTPARPFDDSAGAPAPLRRPHRLRAVSERHLQRARAGAARLARPADLPASRRTRERGRHGAGHRGSPTTCACAAG